MSTPVLSGPEYFKRGFSYIKQPGLRRFVAIPLLINLSFFIAMVYYSTHFFNSWLARLMATIPSWLSFLEYLMWPIFVLLIVLVIFFTFTTLVNLIAAPFNSFLSEKVEVIERGEDHFPPFDTAELLAMVPRTMARELRKLAYFLPRALGLLILSFIPGVNILAAPLWLLFNIWMMAVQYIDYPADNNKLAWNDMLHWLRAKRLQSLSFGGITYLAIMVPIFNLLAMPAAVAGATLFWVHEEGRILPPAKSIE